jgi:hypothetical protein
VFVESQPTDEHTHAIASKLARRFVFTIQAILMEHEKPEALRQAYLVAREGLEEFRSKDDGALTANERPGQ